MFLQKDMLQKAFFFLENEKPMVKFLDFSPDGNDMFRGQRRLDLKNL